DLTPHYNGSLTQAWRGGAAGHTLASLPTGIQRFGAVDFDVRGLIQVGARTASGARFPTEISGIRVGQRCRRLHFLHSAVSAWQLQEGAPIGRYLIHYLGGEQREIPIVLGQDLMEWMGPAGEQRPKPVIAWEGTNEVSRSRDQAIRLFKTTWDNPLPDRPITSIDFSAQDQGAPFLVAITLE